MKTIIFILLISSTLLACKKTISCPDPDILIGFISEPIENIDTIILRKFVANNNYQTLLDTLGVYNNINGNINVYPNGDTLSVRILNNEQGIKQGFDWQIFNPSTNRTYNISDIEKKEIEKEYGTFETQFFCRDEITKISINNQNAIPNSFRFNVLFLR